MKEVRKDATKQEQNGKPGQARTRTRTRRDRDRKGQGQGQKGQGQEGTRTGAGTETGREETGRNGKEGKDRRDT